MDKIEIPQEMLADAVRQALADYMTTRAIFDPEFVAQLARDIVAEQQRVKDEKAKAEAAAEAATQAAYQKHMMEQMAQRPVTLKEAMEGWNHNGRGIYQQGMAGAKQLGMANDVLAKPPAPAVQLSIDEGKIRIAPTLTERMRNALGVLGVAPKKEP